MSKRRSDPVELQELVDLGYHTKMERAAAALPLIRVKSDQGLYLWLAMMSDNKDGRVWGRSKPYIAAKLGWTEKTLYNGLQRLSDHGLVRIEPRRWNDGKIRENAYVVLGPAIGNQVPTAGNHRQPAVEPSATQGSPSATQGSSIGNPVPGIDPTTDPTSSSEEIRSAPARREKVKDAASRSRKAKGAQRPTPEWVTRAERSDKRSAVGKPMPMALERIMSALEENDELHTLDTAKMRRSYGGDDFSVQNWNSVVDDCMRLIQDPVLARRVKALAES